MDLLWVSLRELMTTGPRGAMCHLMIKKSTISFFFLLFKRERNPRSGTQDILMPPENSSACASCIFSLAVYDVILLLKQAKRVYEVKHPRKSRKPEINHTGIAASYSPRAFSQKSAPA